MCAHYLGLTDAELERLVDELTMQCQRSRARVGADDEFAGVGVGVAKHMARILDHRNLHA